MIFNGIKRRWMRKVVTKKAREDRSTVIWPQSMVVICEVDQIKLLETFKDWASALKIKAINVTVLCLVNDVKKETIDGVITFDQKAIKWSGGFNNVDYENVLDQPADLQINYFKDSNELLDFTSNYMRSRLKVGFGNEEDSINDLTIKMDQNDHQLFIKELKKYLSILTQ